MLSSEVRILDPQVKDHFDTFQVVFLSAARQTVFPELLEIFGPEALVKFLDIFGGLTLKVPDRTVLERAARDTDIYVTLTKKDDPDVLDYLARKYDTSPSIVRDIWYRVKQTRARMGLPV